MSCLEDRVALNLLLRIRSKTQRKTVSREFVLRVAYIFVYIRAFAQLYGGKILGTKGKENKTTFCRTSLSDIICENNFCFLFLSVY